MVKAGQEREKIREVHGLYS